MLIQEAKRLQQLAGIITEAEDAKAEQAVEKGLKSFLNILQSAEQQVKVSPNDGKQNEIFVTLASIIIGAPGLLNLLGKGADLIGQYFSQGAVNKTKIGDLLKTAGHNLENQYIGSLAGWIKAAYPKSYGDQDPFDKTSELHDLAHGAYASLLVGAAIGSGLEAGHAINAVVKGLEGGAAAFKTSEVADLAKKIVAA